MSEPLHTNHYAEAERCLSRAARLTRPDGPFADPETSHLLIAQAQAHATLAALPSQVRLANENIKEYRAERDAYKAVIVGHVFEALMSDSAQVRRLASNIASELDSAGVNVDEELFEHSEHSGHGPHHHTVNGVAYELLKQVVDCEGVAWEHNGGWTEKQEPVMATDLVFVPPKPDVALPDLVRTRGPLTVRKTEAPF